MNVARVSLSKLCMAVRNRFTIEMYEFTHSLHIFLACATNCAIVTETSRIEDVGRLENESRSIKERQLLNSGMKDVRITVTRDRDDLPVST